MTLSRAYPIFIHSTNHSLICYCFHPSPLVPPSSRLSTSSFSSMSTITPLQPNLTPKHLHPPQRHKIQLKILYMMFLTQNINCTKMNIWDTHFQSHTFQKGKDTILVKIRNSQDKCINYSSVWNSNCMSMYQPSECYFTCIGNFILSDWMDLNNDIPDHFWQSSDCIRTHFRLGSDSVDTNIGLYWKQKALNKDIPDHFWQSSDCIRTHFRLGSDSVDTNIGLHLEWKDPDKGKFHHFHHGN